MSGVPGCVESIHHLCAELFKILPGPVVPPSSPSRLGGVRPRFTTQVSSQKTTGEGSGRREPSRAEQAKLGGALEVSKLR